MRLTDALDQQHRAGWVEPVAGADTEDRIARWPGSTAIPIGIACRT